MPDQPTKEHNWAIDRLHRTDLVAMAWVFLLLMHAQLHGE